MSKSTNAGTRRVAPPPGPSPPPRLARLGGRPNASSRKAAGVLISRGGKEARGLGLGSEGEECDSSAAPTISLARSGPPCPRANPLSRRRHPGGAMEGQAPRLARLTPQTASRLRAAAAAACPAAALTACLAHCLDAGATRIDIELDLGGAAPGFAVADDGRGAATWASALTAPLPGGDSGGGGWAAQALAAVCATAEVEVTSRCAGGFETRRVLARGGAVVQSGLAPAHRALQGSTVVVRDIYFNQPVKRGALRGAGCARAPTGGACRTLHPPIHPLQRAPLAQPCPGDCAMHACRDVHGFAATTHRLCRGGLWPWHVPPAPASRPRPAADRGRRAGAANKLPGGGAARGWSTLCRQRLCRGATARPRD